VVIKNARRAVVKGFTLLELLVVMVIIGLLAGLVAPRYFAQVGKSQTKVAKAQIDSLEKALDQYRLDVGHYPSTEEGLQALVAAPSRETRSGRAVPAQRGFHPILGDDRLRPRPTRHPRRTTTYCRLVKTAERVAPAKTRTS
jgi:prepilin-type N-terminal cleavage/methylation domain-containing protein